jgi:hypothetical protein
MTPVVPRRGRGTESVETPVGLRMPAWAGQAGTRTRAMRRVGPGGGLNALFSGIVGSSADEGGSFGCRPMRHDLMESEAFGPWRERAQAHQREASASDRWVLPLATRSRRRARLTTSTRCSNGPWQRPLRRAALSGVRLLMAAHRPARQCHRRVPPWSDRTCMPPRSAGPHSGGVPAGFWFCRSGAGATDGGGARHGAWAHWRP